MLVWSADAAALVCPAAYQQSPGFSMATVRSAERGWPIATRPSGGGAVPQGKGILNLAMAATFSAGFTIEDGYRLITRPIRSCLAQYGLTMETGATPGSFCDGAWNLSASERKVVGTAQRWRPSRGGKVRILAHAVILTHGRIDTSAAAVDAFHRDLGLLPIRSDVHTSLEMELGRAAPEKESLAAMLIAAAQRELTRSEPLQPNRAAA